MFFIIKNRLSEMIYMYKNLLCYKNIKVHLQKDFLILLKLSEHVQRVCVCVCMCVCTWECLCV